MKTRVFMKYSISAFNKKYHEAIICFFKKAFKEDGRKLMLNDKDSDIVTIEETYMKQGFFWCAIDNKTKKILGTIALRPIDDFWEIRRFFVLKKEQNKGIGQKLLETAIEFAINNKYKVLKAATLERGYIAHHLFEKYGFCPTKRFNNSTADIFYKLVLSSDFIYRFKLNKLKEKFDCSLILNPTENIPIYDSKYDCSFMEGLYVSERFKDVNDKVIFSGRNDYISFFEFIKEHWKEKLSAFDVDLKTLSGLNAHLILFLCIIQKGDTVMLLPESCGGHFATEKILQSLGVTVISMCPDFQNKCVDVQKTKALIEEFSPNYIFVDRSEGLNYEDFSWISEYKNSYKIFDASQYFSQIVDGKYASPFEMGFDMIITTLHKNYPGPQKGLIAVKYEDDVWKRYLDNAKTYISNTHPMAIAKSLVPIIQETEFSKYSETNLNCSHKLEEALKQHGLPIVHRNNNSPATLHIWILCETKEKSYEYYLKLEQLGLLTNYRLLPYNLGFGLRIGTSAAVKSGLKEEHIKELASIMAEAYYNPVTDKLLSRSFKFIKRIIEG